MHNSQFTIHNWASAEWQLCIMNYELCIKNSKKMEKSEVKRPYEKPEIQVIELDSTPQLLAQSKTPEEVQKMWGN